VDVKVVLEKLNITKWHKQGITGKGTKVAIMGFEAGAHHNGAWLIKQAAPDAEVREINIMKGGISFEQAFKECIVWGADVICCSLRKSTWSAEQEMLSKTLYDQGCIMIDSSDNEGDPIDAWPALSPYWFVVGAYNSKWNEAEGYSSYGPKLDFLGYTSLDCPNKYGNMIPITHTSGATQVPSGMTALLKESHNITPEGFKQFIAENSVDIGTQGKDDKSGWGLLMMPDEVYANKIELTIGKPMATVNSKAVTLDAPPIIMNDRTMVPIRFVAEALGCKVGWDEITQTVTIEK